MIDPQIEINIKRPEREYFRDIPSVHKVECIISFKAIENLRELEILEHVAKIILDRATFLKIKTFKEANKK